MLRTTSRTTLALSIFLGSALCTDLTISSMTDFNAFKGNPSDYDNVYLSTDLDFNSFSSGYTPISNFAGTFDGQGHTIKNLEITSTEEHVGIFGSLASAKIKNLIIDSSCSMTSSHVGSGYNNFGYLGSVVGQCKRCTFENIINRASVTFTNSGHPGRVYVGGIAGEFSYEPAAATMTNVVNYGAVTNELTNNENTDHHIATGGLIGYSLSILLQKVTLTNCINYGKVTSKNTNNEKTYTAGIIGYAYGYPVITRTISAGTISSQTSQSTGLFIGCGVGSISGGISGGEVTFANSYYMSDLGATKIVGSATGFTLTGESSIDTFAENYFAGLKDGNVWIYNPNNKEITFNVNDNTAVKLSSTLIIAPILANIDDSHTFKGWFTDDYCSDDFAVDSMPTEDKTLYGGWEYTVTFDPNEGSIAVGEITSRTVIFNNKIGYIPTPTMTGFTFNAWYDARTGGNVVEKGTTMWTAEDVTIYAHWDINQYNITFVYGNGADPTIVTLDYEEDIVLPSDPTRTEYAFLGWSMTNDEGVRDVYTRMPAYNLTITADWLINNYTVTFVFYEGHGDMSSLCDYNSEIVFPTESDTDRPGYTFNGWDDKVTKTVPSGGITFTGNWTINSYILTIDFCNGTDPLVYELEYNEAFTLPEKPTKNGFNFGSWKNVPSPLVMPAENLTITAQWIPNNYTVTFDFDNETTVNVTFSYGSLIAYPNDVIKEGYTLSWNNYHEFMPAKNITITAQWTPNNYTVKLDLGNGTIMTSIKVTFNSPYGTLPTPTKDGYTFIGWVTDNNDTVTSETKVTIPNNHTLHARWKEIPTQYVEIVFGTKDMTEEEINGIVKKYANASDFTIIKVEGGGGGDGTRVIIKFNSAEKAEEFVRIVNENKRSDSLIKRVCMTTEAPDFSSPQTLFSFLFVFFM